MISDNSTSTPPVVAILAIPDTVKVLGNAELGHWWECQTEYCDADADAGSADEAILGAALHSFGHGKTAVGSALQEVLSEAAGGRYVIRFPVRTGGGDVVVEHPGGLRDVQVRCEHCGWTWHRFSQPLTHAAAAVHAACAHDPHRHLPDELLDVLDDVLQPRRELQVAEAVTKAVTEAVEATVAETEAPLRERIAELEAGLATAKTAETEATSRYDALIDERATQRLQTELDRTDAQIARSDVKPGIILAGVTLGLVEGVKQLTTGQLPLPAAITGWAAAGVAVVGAVYLVVSVLPRISQRWGGFGMVAIADMSADEISHRARELAADAQAIADAEKLRHMTRLGMRKHSLVRRGMLITLLGAAPLAVLAALFVLTGWGA